MLSGFSRQTFFSFDQSLLDKVVDENSSLNLDHNEYTILKDGVMVGHFSKTMNESVRFSPVGDNKIIGSKPNSLDEIVISTAMAKKLMGTIDGVINSSLLVSYNNNERLLDNGDLIRTFKDAKMRVTGLIESDRYEIYHESYWTINFFKSRLGVSAFNLVINSIAFESDDINDALLENMSRSFPNYEVVDPMDGISDSVEQICGYIEIALSAFSVIATIIASLLLTMCTYLHVLDSQKEIALSRCIGVSKKESKKFVIYHTLIMCFLSLIISTVEMIIVSFVSSFVVASSLHSQAVFSFDIKGVLFMVIIALLIAFISSIWVSNRVSKLNPLDVLKK